MSIVPKETIEVIAQSIGINNLSQDVALALAPDVEYRMREIMQEAIKCMRHSRRTTLTTDDVDSALNLRNVEPIYGFSCNDPLGFKKAVGHKGLFYIDDKDLDFREVIDAPLPKAPLDTTVVCHWLAIEGIQPAIPENASVEVISTPPDTKKTEQKDDGLPVDIRLPVKHVLSRELQLYFDKITELTMSRSDSTLFKEALQSLATDSGLHPLVPYFTCFAADEVSRGLSDFRLLFALMRLVQSLLHNPHIHVEPYLHQLMPSVVTCLVAKKLGNRLTDNHWELREFSANLVASICKRFGHVYNNLQTRLTKTLVHAFLDPKRTLTQHYGAIQGLAALGPHVVRLLLLPNLETYLKLLEPELFMETQKNGVKRYEAWRVYGALQRASGQCIFERLKLFPMLIPPPSKTFMMKAGRIICSKEPKAIIKRKASTDLDEDQPPQKKLATDGPSSEVVSIPNNNLASSSSEVQGTTNTVTTITTTTATATATAINNLGGAGPASALAALPLCKPSPSSSSSMMVSESVVAAALARNKAGMVEVLKISAMLNQVWKDDLNSGHLPAIIVDQFGESLLHPFIPTTEKNIFI